jgi:hypothetical protein
MPSSGADEDSSLSDIAVGDAPIANGPIAERVAVVGVCASGKSVLVRELRALGYDARHVAQEHSYVPDMWQRLTRPQILVYLGASLATVRRRRDPSFPAALFQEQRRRLRHARCHCQICVCTDPLTESQVLARVVAALKSSGLRPSSDIAPSAPEAARAEYSPDSNGKGRKKC